MRLAAVVAERDGQLDRPDLEGDLAVELRARDVDLGSDVDRDRDLGEPQVDGDAGGRRGVDPHVEPERVEEDDAVGAEHDVGPGRAELGRGLSLPPAMSASEVSAK